MASAPWCSWGPSASSTLEITAEVAAECLDAGLPLMVEALPCPCERIPDPHSADAMASACRIGFEHGADVIKTYAHRQRRELSQGDRELRRCR